MMHKIYNLQKEAHEAYSVLNFPKGGIAFLIAGPVLISCAVVAPLIAFCNVTLSAFYFNVTKDTLYADLPDLKQRRAVLTVLQHVGELLQNVRYTLKIADRSSTR
jgi:isoleucyl-tRNA synthetase